MTTGPSAKVRGIFLFAKKLTLEGICKSGSWSALVDVRKYAVRYTLTIPFPCQAVFLLTVMFITSFSMNKQADEIDHVEIW